MLPDRVSNPGPLTYESDALTIALCGPAKLSLKTLDKEHYLQLKPALKSWDMVSHLNDSLSEEHFSPQSQRILFFLS